VTSDLITEVPLLSLLFK